MICLDSLISRYQYKKGLEENTGKDLYLFLCFDIAIKELFLQFYVEE